MGESKGRVCEKHNEYAADGQCRWCEPMPEAGVITAREIMERNPFVEVPPTPAPADEPPRYAAPKYLGMPVKVDPSLDPPETRFAGRRFVQCQCGECTFDASAMTQYGLPVEGNTQDGRLHSPGRCGPPRQQPPSFISCRCGEVMFNPAMYGPNLAMEHFSAPDQVHTPKYCTRHRESEQDVLRRLFPTAKK